MTQHELDRLNKLQKSIYNIEYLARILEGDSMINISRASREEEFVVLHPRLKEEFAHAARRIGEELKQEFKDIKIIINNQK